MHIKGFAIVLQQGMVTKQGKAPVSVQIFNIASKQNI